MKGNISIRQKNYRASCTASSHPNPRVSTSVLFRLQTAELLSIYSRSVKEDADSEGPATAALNAKKLYFPSKSEENSHASLLCFSDVVALVINR